jgi:hypothetical protein
MKDHFDYLLDKEKEFHGWNRRWILGKDCLTIELRGWPLMLFPNIALFRMARNFYRGEWNVKLGKMSNDSTMLHFYPISPKPA